jgi:hypothetical protein
MTTSITFGRVSPEIVAELTRKLDARAKPISWPFRTMQVKDMVVYPVDLAKRARKAAVRYAAEENARELHQIQFAFGMDKRTMDIQIVRIA